MDMQPVTSLPTDKVMAQLARVVESRQFQNAPRLSRFLTYVVEQSMAGRSDRLKGYTVGVEVFDKDPDFDPQTDTIVRVQARALRQKLDQYYLQDGVDDPVRIVVRKGGYEPEFSLISNEKQQKVDSVSLEIPKSDKPSIAVLPFEYIGLEAEYGFLSHGLTEGVISKLSRFKDLSVFSRSTTEKAKMDQLSIHDMYTLFRPDFVLEGSFRIRNEMMETRIRLIDAAADAVLMTDQVGIRMDAHDAYEAQDEIIARITARIGVEYGSIGQAAQKNLGPKPSIKWETYGWISRYFQYGFQLDQAGRDEIEAGLKHAVRADPNSSEAHAALSMIEIEYYRAMTHAAGDPERLERAMKHARLAVRQDPQSAMAHQAMALAYFHEKRFSDFRASVRRALQLNPGHSDMLAMFGMCFVRRAAWDEAMPLLDRALVLNPMHPDWYHLPKAMFLMMTKGPKDAIEEFTKSPKPGNFAFHFILLWFHIEADDMAAAEFEKEKVLAIAPDAETSTRQYFDTICLCDEIADRAIAAFRKVGLHLA